MSISAIESKAERPLPRPTVVNGRLQLITRAPFFCFAGTWRSATSDWPAAFAGLTVEAYPDIAPFQDRHMAVVHEDDWMDWLEQSRSAESILRPFPPGSLKVSGPPACVSADLPDGLSAS